MAANFTRLASFSPLGRGPGQRRRQSRRDAFVSDTKGITILDDWTGFGHRVTGSGTTLLDNVEVHPFSILSFQVLFDRPTAMGPFAQIMHAAIEQASLKLRLPIPQRAHNRSVCGRIRANASDNTRSLSTGSSLIARQHVWARRRCLSDAVRHMLSSAE
jgi:hypothetical protein